MTHTAATSSSAEAVCLAGAGDCCWQSAGLELPRSMLSVGGPAPQLSEAVTRQLLELAAQAKEYSRHDGAMEELLLDSFVALLGEGVAAPRRSRSWARPVWCAGRCPGCARRLRLLLVPTLDVIECVYCATPAFACVHLEPM